MVVAVEEAAEVAEIVVETKAAVKVAAKGETSRNPHQGDSAIEAPSIRTCQPESG